MAESAVVKKEDVSRPDPRNSETWYDNPVQEDVGTGALLEGWYILGPLNKHANRLSLLLSVDRSVFHVLSFYRSVWQTSVCRSASADDTRLPRITLVLRRVVSRLNSNSVGQNGSVNPIEFRRM